MSGPIDKLLIALTVVAAGLLGIQFSPAGCRTTTTPPAGGPATTKMRIGTMDFTLEIAAKPTAREVGLMYRESMPPDRGMIFVFPRDEEHSFWMKNTRIPLDIIYANSAGNVVSIKQMTPFSTAGVPSDGPAKYAIELNQGMAAKAGVKAGDRLEIPKEVPEVKD